MSHSASQASEFYKQIALNKRLCTIKDANGFMTSGNSMPFWSSVARAEKIVCENPAYKDFKPFEITWEEFVSKWIPGLKKDNLLVGANWSGANVTGYDITPAELQHNIEALLQIKG